MQVNALVYAMGDEADGIMAGFGLTEEERGAPKQTVKTKFDKHFVVSFNGFSDHDTMKIRNWLEYFW